MRGLVPLREDLFFPIEQTFEKFYRDFFGDKSNLNVAKSASGYPKVNAYLDGDEYKMVFSVPGVDKSNLNIELEGNSVTIKGCMSEKYCADKDSEYFVRELRQSYFTRTMTVPEGVVGEPEALLENGILALTWQTERARNHVAPKRIEIKTSTSPPS